MEVSHAHWFFPSRSHERIWSTQSDTGEGYMKKVPLLAASIVPLFVVLGCGVSDITGGVLGNTMETPTPLPTNTSPPLPTDTAIPPTSTPKPTNTPRPTAMPKVKIGQFEQALKRSGYSQFLFPDGSGSAWTLDNVFENTYTLKSGVVEMEVLNSLKSRLEHMEKKLTIMDGLFPADFMTQLREENGAFADTVGAGVTGKPVDSYGPNPGDFWQFQSAYYNVLKKTIGAYDVQFSLFFEQWTCPPEYICTFPSFGNQQFTGQASFVFYDLMLELAI
jgi:hypothetical protein